MEALKTKTLRIGFAALLGLGLLSGLLGMRANSGLAVDAAPAPAAIIADGGSGGGNGGT